jgi:hypothetical protein
MPNRYLRESYIESEAVSGLSWQAESTYLRLIVTVDDWGRCEANLKLLRPKLFPLRLTQVREADVQRWIAECEKAGLVRLYENGGKPYLQMMKWEKGRSEKSKYPHPPVDVLENCFLQTSANSRKHLQTSVNICLQPSTNVPDTDTDTDYDTDHDTGGANAPTCEEVLEAWNAKGVFSSAEVLNDKRRKSLNARIKERFFRENWRKALDIAAETSFLTGGGARGWVADLDWFIKPGSVVAIIEGKYSSLQNAKPAPKTVEDLQEEFI